MKRPLLLLLVLLAPLLLGAMKPIGLTRKATATVVAGPQIITANIATLNESGTSVHTFACNATGADFLLLAFYINYTAGFDVSGCTYAGSAMTVVSSQGSGSNEIRIYRIDTPSTGTNNLVITATGTSQVWAFGLPMSGVSAGTTIGTPQVGTATSATATTAAITSASGELVVAIAGSTNVVTPAGTSVSTLTVGGRTVNVQTYPGAASVTPTWTLTSAAWITNGVPVKP